MQLAQALDYAHQQGVLHRDVKPANVLLSAEGSPKLADFNISFCSQLEGATPAAYFGGSLAYMSPEQLEACNPDHDRKPRRPRRPQRPVSPGGGAVGAACTASGRSPTTSWAAAGR